MSSAADVRMLEHRAVRFLEDRLNAIGRFRGSASAHSPMCLRSWH